MKKALDIIAGWLHSISDAYDRPRAYRHPSTGAFMRDQRQLSGDVKKVGDDMRRAIDKSGKHKHQSSGNR